MEDNVRPLRPLTKAQSGQFQFQISIAPPEFNEANEGNNRKRPDWLQAT